jgi:hypothetical protein
VPAPSIGRRARFNTSATHIDWSHRLADGLRFCITGDRWVDLVTGARATNAGESQQSSQFGTMRGFAATTGAQVPVDLRGATDLSVGVVLRWVAFANDDALLCEMSANAGTNDGFFVDPNSSTATSVETKVRIGSQNRDYRFNRPAGGITQIWTFDMPFSGIHLAWFDGAKQTGTANGAQGTHSGSLNTNTLNIASRNATTLRATCHIAMLCIWSRLQGDNGAAAFRADPYAMLRG